MVESFSRVETGRLSASMRTSSSSTISSVAVFLFANLGALNASMAAMVTVRGIKKKSEKQKICLAGPPLKVAVTNCHVQDEKSKIALRAEGRFSDLRYGSCFFSWDNYQMSRAHLQDEENLSSSSFLSPEAASQKQAGRKRPTLLKRLSATSLRPMIGKDQNNGEPTQAPEAATNRELSGDEGSISELSKRSTHQRKHSHTISGGIRPPPLDTRQPSPPRRGSDGPPLQIPYPTTINISAPTPTTATFSKEVFSTATTGLTFELLQSQATPSNTDFGDDVNLGNYKSLTPIASPEQPEGPIAPSGSIPFGLEPLESPRPQGISLSTMTSTTSLGSSGSDLNRTLSLPSQGKIGTRRKANKRRESLDTTTSSEGGFSSAVGSVATVCGLELANAKRNTEFHTLFRSVPEDDLLIEGTEKGEILGDKVRWKL